MKGKNQLELDDERPAEKDITVLGGVECWYYHGPIPPKPPRAPCVGCGGPTYGPAMFYAHDRQYHWLCKRCGLVPPLSKEPEPLQNDSGSDNQSVQTDTRSPRQMELLPPPAPLQG